MVLIRRKGFSTRVTAEEEGRCRTRIAYHTDRRIEANSDLDLAELLGALSFALDLTEGQPEGHCVRACWIGDHIGQALVVSNQILDKPSKLDDDEWRSVRSHPFYSRQILERVTAFSDTADVAGAHHERLDGKGYPFGFQGDEVCRKPASCPSPTSSTPNAWQR